MAQFPEVELVVVPIGGGGLISGISMAVKSINPDVRVVGVESSGAPAMKRSVEAGGCIVLEEMGCIIDGLRVMRVGDNTCSVVSRFVDELVTLPGRADLRRHAVADDAGQAGDGGGRRVAGGCAASGAGRCARRDQDRLRAERGESGCGGSCAGCPGISGSPRCRSARWLSRQSVSISIEFLTFTRF